MVTESPSWKFGAGGSDWLDKECAPAHAATANAAHAIPIWNFVGDDMVMTVPFPAATFTAKKT
jgi:hypothetical protein